MYDRYGRHGEEWMHLQSEKHSSISVDLCLQLPRRQIATTFFLSIFSLTPWLVSLGFISICPHFASSCGSGVKAEMQTWKEDVCISVCVCLCQDEGERAPRRKEKKK